MKLKLVAAAILASTMLCGTAASAQDSPTGSRVSPRLEKGPEVDPNTAIKASHTFYRCIYSRRDRAVKRLLTTLDWDDFSNAADLVFARTECFSNLNAGGGLADSLSFQSSPSSARGLLAEAALNREGYLKASAPDLPVLPMAEGYNRVWFKMTMRSNTIDAMSACFADTQPAMVKALLMTEPTSAEEGQQIGQIAGMLGPCLLEGASLNANAFSLRGALAEAYFQRAMGSSEEVIRAPATTSSSAAG